MDHHPSAAIVMTSGGDVLTTETATDVPVTAAPRIGAFQNVVLAIRMERTVGLLSIAAPPIADPPIADPWIADPRIDSLLSDVSQSGVMGILVPTIAALLLIVAPEIRAQVTAGLPSIVDPQPIAPPRTGSRKVVPLKALSQINVYPNVVLKIRAQRIVGHLLIAALLIVPTESDERVLRNVVVRAAAAAKSFQDTWMTNRAVSRVLMPQRLWPMICSGGVMPLRRL
jgi:hypothetical protein